MWPAWRGRANAGIHLAIESSGAGLGYMLWLYGAPIAPGWQCAEISHRRTTLYSDRTEARPMPIPLRKPQAGDFGEEVGGSSAMGWMPDLQEEIQNAGKPQAGWHDC